jgi:hypothetical protein
MIQSEIRLSLTLLPPLAALAAGTSIPSDLVLEKKHSICTCANDNWNNNKLEYHVAKINLMNLTLSL